MPDQLFADPYLAQVYDAWHPRSVRDDYDFYMPRILSATSVLDVGCGTGTLLSEARLKGHSGRLCGLDPAFGMLASALRIADVEWVQGDLQSGTWEGEFDLIVMTGHAFQTLVTDDELRVSLQAVRRALSPGGCFAFETRNPKARAWDRWRPENLVTVQMPDGNYVQIKTHIISPFDGRTITFAHTFDGPHSSLPQISRSTLRFLDVELLREILQSGGFDIEGEFGDFDGQPLSYESPEIIMIARRDR